MVMKLMLSIIFSLIALFFTSYLNLSIFFTEFFRISFFSGNSIISSLNVTAVPLDFLHYLYFEDQMSLIFVFAVLSMLITVLLFVLSYLYSHLAASSGGVFLLQPTERDEEYECGYGAFGHAQTNWIALQFFVVGILFLIFDLELALLFVLANYIGHVSALGIFVAFVFVIMLVIGFIYEWSKGALDWK